MNVLVVDDHPTNRKLLRVVLEAEGVTVHEAADGREAMATLETQPVDAIISDILMPNMDGYRLCYELRRNTRFQHLPFVLYTGTYNSAADQTLAQEMGADAFISKPASAETILRTLRQISPRPRPVAPSNTPVPREVDLMKHYSERLVAKLEEQNAELEQRLAELRGANEMLRDSRRSALNLMEDAVEARQRSDQTAEALRRSQSTLARAQEIAHLGSYELDLESPGNNHWSDEAFRIMGRDSTQAVVSTEVYIQRIVHAEDQARVRETLDKALSQRSRFDLEYRIVRPDGSVRHVHSVAEPMLGPDKEVLKLVGFLQDVTERKELENQIIEISEREQSRIGQDLHDGLCQHLAGIEFRLLDLKQKLERRAKKQAAETTELARLLREGIEQTRTLARGLSPVMLEPAGLMNALQELALSTDRTFRISCSLSCPAPVLIQDNAVATHLYRIAQEAVHNAIRHGKAKFIVISLLTANDRIILAVKDDGVGFRQQARQHQGMGLRVMQYRAGVVGGSLVVQREPEGGTSVICSLRPDRADVKPTERDARSYASARPSAALVAAQKPRRHFRSRRAHDRKDVAPSD